MTDISEQTRALEDRYAEIRQDALQLAVTIEHELPPALTVPTDDISHDESCTTSAVDADKLNGKARDVERATIGRILRHAQLFEKYIQTGYTDEDMWRAELLAGLMVMDSGEAGDGS